MEYTTDRKPPSIQESLGNLGQNQCGRQNLQESIASRIFRAEQSSHEAVKLKRLAEILDAHPYLLEMLEIVRDLGLV